METLKTLEEIFAPTKPKKLYCNLSDVYFIWHGEWADPEVMYEDKLFNLPMYVETPLYDYYCEYCKENGIKESDNGFAEYVENHSYDVYEMLNNLIEAGLYEEV